MLLVVFLYVHAALTDGAPGLHIEALYSLLCFVSGFPHGFPADLMKSVCLVRSIFLVNGPGIGTCFGKKEQSARHEEP